MTPDRKPFFAAIFIPKHSRFGRPGMMELVPRVAELWRSDRQRLLVRPRETYDGAMASGNSIAAWVLHRLSRLTGRKDLQAAFETSRAAAAGDLAEAPAGHTFLLWAWVQELEPPTHVVVGDANDPDTTALLEAAAGCLSRRGCLLRLTPSPSDPLRRLAPFLARYHPSQGAPAAYVCRDFTCKLPVTRPEEVRDLLRPPAPPSP